MTPYFYIIQHISTGMYYAGAKWAKDADPKMFWVEYFTSCNWVLQILEEEGPGSFIIRRLMPFSSVNEAISYETRFLRKVNDMKLTKGWYQKSDEKLEVILSQLLEKIDVI